ncbi:MAG: hypothetical protein GY838_18765 [bacterium]|nr:hypothetical protein [bacterium]
MEPDMPLLLHIAFDNLCRLEHDEYLFEYNGVPFKLIQNDPRRWSDVLLTIVPHENADEADSAYAAAGEFLSAVSWVNRSPILLRYSGGIGQAHFGDLREALCHCFDTPEFHVGGNVVGFTIDRLPKIETSPQRIALALMRDARGANVASLAFLYFWQILEVAGEPARAIADRLFDADPARYDLLPIHAEALGMNGRSIGECLLEDYRHAVAHIRRDHDRRSFVLDNLREVQRFSIARRLAENLAQAYIESDLNLGGPVWLTPVRGHEFPVYVDEDFMRAGMGDIVRD